MHSEIRLVFTPAEDLPDVIDDIMNILCCQIENIALCPISQFHIFF